VSDVIGPSVLIISGLPGAGKTHYAKWLEARGHGRVSIDETVNKPAKDWSRLQVAVVAAINGEDEPLRFEAGAYRGVVIEWGFHPLDMGRLSEMIRRGYIAWFFDGDRAAANESWREAHPGDPDDVWLEQVARLDGVKPEIRTMYGSNIIETVHPGPVHLSPEKINRRLGCPAD
jgi:hypothetical protein